MALREDPRGGPRIYTRTWDANLAAARYNSGKEVQTKVHKRRSSDCFLSTAPQAQRRDVEADGRRLAQLRLEIELVPGASWHSNLRRILPRRVWDKIRKEAYKAAGHKCEICGAEGRLECHEWWEYDDRRRVQRLAGFMALCPLCHAVKHMGRSGNLAR